jgi:hypothetical protein
MIALPVAMTRAVPADRKRDLSILVALVLWLAYTRVFWGGTRSFAFMWQGDIANSVRLYPLGPALFVGTLAGAGALAAGLVTGRTWTPRLTRVQWISLAIAAASLVAFSWALKVFILGN